MELRIEFSEVLCILLGLFVLLSSYVLLNTAVANSQTFYEFNTLIKNNILLYIGLVINTISGVVLIFAPVVKHIHRN